MWDLVDSSHGWRNQIRQQETIEENARRIEAAQTTIMEMQESLQQLTGSEASVRGRQSSGAGETRG